MKKRKFSKEDKLQIIKEASEQGVTATLENHGIYPATFYSWKKKFETMGEAEFRHGMTPAQLKEIKRLEKENGHVESFHGILSRALGNNNFWSLELLNQRLTVFYEKYNNVRLHGAIANLPPRLFWEMWEKNRIIRKEFKNRKVRFYSKIPYHQLSGNENLREVPCLNHTALDEPEDLPLKVNGPDSLKQPSVKR